MIRSAAAPGQTRRRVPVAGVALALAATALVFAAVAVVAGSVGPLVAHPPTRANRPPQAITGADVPVASFAKPPVPTGDSWNAGWLWWIGAAVLMLAVAAAVWWLVLVLRRRVPRPLTSPAPVAPPHSIAAMLGSVSGPAEADLGAGRTFIAARAADDIIASWEIVEAAAAAGGRPRRPAATPTEFLVELASGFGDTSTAQADADVLLGLYHRARFDVVALAPGAATAARAASAALVRRLASGAAAGLAPGIGAGRP